MKLHSIRLAEFRRFAEPVVFDGLEPGLNLFTGANEAGKSTVAVAVRAAFLERHRTSTVAGFAPYGVSGARPTVELAFEAGGHDYVLRKSFITRPRCELTIDGERRIDGEAAEDELGRLLGFSLSARGQSRPEHAGVPGLLWIRQGDSGERAPMQHAGAHLREALNRVAGEVAGGEGDRLLARVAAERAALLDVRGKPRGVLREAEEAVTAASAEVEQLTAARAAVVVAVDRFSELRGAQSEDEREQPWLNFEQQASEARAREQAAGRLQAELDALLRERRQGDETLALLQDQVRRDQQEGDELLALRGRIDEVGDVAAVAAHAVDDAARAHAQATAALTAARERQEATRVHAERHDVANLVQRQAAELDRLERAVEQADRLQAQARRLSEVVGRTALNESDVIAVREAARQMEDSGLRRAAVATRLHYRLQGEAVTLDGKPLRGEGEQLLTEPVRIGLPAGGSLLIEPGGADLAGLAHAQTQASARLTALLQALDAASLADVEARWLDRQAAARDAEAVHRELAIHAPQGRDALQQARDDARRALTGLQARLTALEGVPANHASTGEARSATSPPLDAPRDPRTAQAELDLAQLACDQAADRLAAAREQRQRSALQAEQLVASEQALAFRLGHADAARQRDERNRRLTETRALCEDLDRRIAETRERLAAHRPDLIQQDIVRFERSARVARDGFQTRQREMLLLQGRLDEAGAQGLGERLAEAANRLARSRRRHDGLRARAAALSLLHDMLQSRRDAATQRLQTPLAARLTHYLDLLLPGARLRIDDALLPTGLERAGATGELESLSHGTQEQLGILARFAYADLLRESGRPTLLILDDALVHSDAQRLGAMKRALFDAATRHQILIFTCHAPAWRDLGVVPRALPARGDVAYTMP